MRTLIRTTSVVMIMLLSTVCYGGNCTGPKIKGFCLGMTYNEVMENINKLNVKIDRQDFNGGFFVLILRNDDKIIQCSFTIRTKDNTLIVMSFSYDMINGKGVKREDFVGMFCKKYNVPKMEYKYDGEWIYQYNNMTEDYNIIMYDKAVKISIIDKK